MIRGRGMVVERGTTRILDGVDIAVSRGTWVSVVGPNGAGKSTLLAALAGLVPCRGTLTFAGEPVGCIRRGELARRVAVVPQIPFLPERLRVGEYLLLGRTPHLGTLGIEGPRDLAIVRSVVERLDLVWALDRVVTTLSGGELQRVVIARALAQEPEVLFLDEPTTGLDLAQQQRVLAAVADLRRASGITIVAAMHDLTAAACVSDELVMLRVGRVIAAGPTSAVLREETLAQLYGTPVRVHELDGHVVVLPAPGDGVVADRAEGSAAR
jgi:iron complex transport system ATP-binding protein